jgi:glycosyltransferase involved in cell wall biosynthesis
MIILAFLTGGIYVLVIASFFYGWEKLSPFKKGMGQSSMVVSIIIPVRNEADNILNLLGDLDRQTYSYENIEILIIDDHSTDRSLELIKSHKSDNLKIISLQEGINGKKAALRAGIEKANGELIITTDADCRVGCDWVWTMVSFYRQVKPVMILAPVVPLNKGGFSYEKWFEEIFFLELYSLLGSTAGSAAIGHPMMSNGANLAFPKMIYPEIEHIYTDSQVPSGDDVFAMLELKKKYPKGIHFLKSMDAAVYSSVPGNFAAFFRQRSRWAAKSKFYRDYGILATAFIVLLINFLLLIALLLGFFQQDYWPFIILLTIKSLIDFPFLYRVTSFFKEKKLMRWFLLAQSIYFFYVCITVFLALVVPNAWKGRKI